MAVAEEIARSSPRVAAAEAGDRPSPVVRTAVRDLLSSCQAFYGLTPEEKKQAAHAMVQVCQTAVSLMQEEARADLAVKASAAPSPSRALAAAQNAGQEFSGVSASKVAGTTRDILNAVSFPRFVTELINGVFRAMVDSNRQQMASYVELIKNVAASVDGFTETNLGGDQARQWLVDTFPGSFVIEGGADEDTAPEDRAEENASARVRLRDGASMPSEQALRAAFGIGPEESVPSGDPETSLVPFARRAIARQRQQMLATMVMLGMQRIVIESGRLHAAMRFHIDTRSAAAAESGSKFNLENQTSISANYWGIQASMKNTIGYVSTQKQQTTEEMNTDLDLNSSVELVFKTDYLPLDRMAGKGQVDRIKVNTINPDAEEKIASQERQARLQGARAADTAREGAIDTALKPAAPATPPAATPPAGGGTAAKTQPKVADGKPATAKPSDKAGGSAGAAQKPASQPGQGASKADASTGRAPARAKSMSLANGARGASAAFVPPLSEGVTAVPLLRQPLQEQCGFWGPDNLAVSATDLRDAIRTAALAERQNWFDAAGNVLSETDNSQFGHLVRYWLARFSSIRPDTLSAAQATAIGGTINYGQLLVNAAATAAVNREAARVRTDLLSGAPGTGAPPDLNNLVEEALRKARSSRMDVDAWSGVFVVFCARQAAIQLGLEAISGGVYVGQDQLLLAHEGHRIFLAEAFRRHFGPNPMDGTYQAFRPSERPVEVGDIIVQDRQPPAGGSIADVVDFNDIPAVAAAGRKLHSDIVVEIPAGGSECVTLGGNLGNSVRRRRYPLSAGGRLIVAPEQLFTQEDDTGNLPAVPSVNAVAGLHGASTARIFAVLSLVDFCAVIPGQQVDNGQLIV